MFLLPDDAWEVRTVKGKGRGIFAKDEAPTRVLSNKVPPPSEIRRIIRDKGRPLFFPELNLIIYGVFDNLLISKSQLE